MSAIARIFVVMTAFGGALLWSAPRQPEDVAPSSTVIVPRRPSRFVLVPQISVLNPGSFTLTNDAYTSHYSKSQFGIPALFVGGAYHLGSRPNLEFYLDGKLGYGSKSGLVPVDRRASGSQLGGSFNEDVRLHYLPLSLGPRAVWSIPGITFLRPTLSAGLGTALLAQVGDSQGFSHTYLLPFYYVTPGLTFLEGNGATDWFGGFQFGVSYLSTFASEQVMHGMAVDLSVNILL